MAQARLRGTREKAPATLGFSGGENDGADRWGPPVSGSNEATRLTRREWVGRNRNARGAVGLGANGAISSNGRSQIQRLKWIRVLNRV